MKRFLVLLVCTFAITLLSGCAAMPTSGEKAVLPVPEISAEDGKGTVYFFREWKFDGSSVSYYIFDGQEKIGASWNGCYFAVPVSPGQHTFWGETGSKRYITINIEPGKDYYIAAAVEMGRWRGLPEFAQITPDIARTIIQNLKYCKLVPKPQDPEIVPAPFRPIYISPY